MTKKTTKQQMEYRVSCSNEKHGQSHKFAKKSKAVAKTRVKELNAEGGPAYRDVCRPWFAEQREAATDWEPVT